MFLFRLVSNQSPVLRAWNYEYGLLDVGRPVRRQELDIAAGGEGRQIIIDDKSMHVMFVSTSVFEEADLDPVAPPEDPFGGTFVRDPETGEHTAATRSMRTYLFPHLGWIAARAHTG